LTSSVASTLATLPLHLQPNGDEDLDLLFRGRVALLQRRQGYRTSIDALMLAAFAAHVSENRPRVLDLGAGSGLVAVLLGLHDPETALTLIERQPGLAGRARRNLTLNGLAARAQVVEYDIAQPWPPTLAGDMTVGFDLVVSNPPYYRRAGRMLPADAERADAHYESSAGIERFVEVAAACLTENGLFCCVYPANGALRLQESLSAVGLLDQRCVHVFHRDGDEIATRVLMAARRGPPRAADAQSWVLHVAEPPNGRYHVVIEQFITDLDIRFGPDA
jgi:tRNA1Val (adenine37-N6)-methyltransferase